MGPQMSALLREKFYSRATPEVPAELRRIAKVSDRPSLLSSRVRRLRHFAALTTNSPPRRAVTALPAAAAAGAAGAWPCDSEAIQVAIGSCWTWRCRSVAAASMSASADCDSLNSPLPSVHAKRPTNSRNGCVPQVSALSTALVIRGTDIAEA